MRPLVSATCLLVIAMVTTDAVKSDVPEAIAVPGAKVVALLQAEGAQIYECQAGAHGALSWQFREPVARLIENGREIGRHAAGPTWTLRDGSSVVAKVTGRAPAATADDIPLLRLEVVSRAGSGRLDAVTAIQRLSTRGGTMTGSCPSAGLSVSVPYLADYVFFNAATK